MSAIWLIVVVFIVLPVCLISVCLVLMSLGFVFRQHMHWTPFRTPVDVGQPVNEMQIDVLPVKPVSKTAHPRLRCFSELSWLIAPVVVVATYAGISASERVSRIGFDSNPSLPQSHPVIPLPRKPEPTAINPAPTDDRTTVSSSAGLTQRPGWVDQLPTDDGISRRIVIASQQYTTREEAEQELSRNASDFLRQDLQRLYPASTHWPSWHPTDENLKRVAIKHQYVEVIERDFGNFIHPMYRVWWQVELSPQVRTEFLPSWRHALTGERIQRVGLVVSTIVLLVSLLTVYHRLNLLTNGTRRTPLKLLTGGAAVLWSMSVIYCLRSMVVMMP